MQNPMTPSEPALTLLCALGARSPRRPSIAWGLCTRCNSSKRFRHVGKRYDPLRLAMKDIRRDAT